MCADGIHQAWDPLVVATGAAGAETEPPEPPAVTYRTFGGAFPDGGETSHTMRFTVRFTTITCGVAGAAELADDFGARLITPAEARKLAAPAVQAAARRARFEARRRLGAAARCEVRSVIFAPVVVIAAVPVSAVTTSAVVLTVVVVVLVAAVVVACRRTGRAGH